MKKITLLLLTLVSYSGFAQFPLPYCGPMTYTSNVEPITLVNFAGINNSTSALVGLDNGTTIIAHEDYTAISGNVTAGSSYTITLKGNTDGNFTTYLRVYVDWNHNNNFTDAGESYDIGTIANSTGADAIQLVGNITVPPTAMTGNTRMRVIKRFGAYGTSCQTGTGYGQAEDYTLVVAALPPDLPDFANLQYPFTATIAQGASVTVYGQVYKGGLTDVAPNIVGQAPGINAWVGYNATDTNPNTWTTWVPATWNSGSVGNNDEYQANIGSNLTPGTYYYATRFQLNGGAYVYGGTNDGFWNGTTKLSGVLTVTPPPVPANDTCSSPTPLTVGGVFNDNAVNTTNLGATLSSETPNPNCGAFNFTTVGKDVWFSVVIPASGSVTLETAISGTSLDTVINAYTGNCSALVDVGCNDENIGPPSTLPYSKLILTGQTAGATILVRAFGYNGAAGTFKISAYDASLGNSSFDNTNFSLYPNPVKDVLNLSYNQEISNVEVYNLLGQKVVSNRYDSNSAQVDMSNLSTGAYVVRVTANGQVKTIKVIKE
ncbi:T9SS type A sorting domain-containing protein [Flavobacterium sp.]|uniref:T9SS type A sorting domain-containing protein n=1 Tax=Flavobacterium sp. TaxID=239 RepID=UPI0025F093CC|nr:T9SS type A sorting domain-containing protein [Flavobacterium sp.]